MSRIHLELADEQLDDSLDDLRSAYRRNEADSMPGAWLDWLLAAACAVVAFLMFLSIGR